MAPVTKHDPDVGFEPDEDPDDTWYEPSDAELERFYEPLPALDRRTEHDV